MMQANISSYVPLLAVKVVSAWWLPFLLIIFIALLLTLFFLHRLHIKNAQLNQMQAQLLEQKNELAKLDEIKELIPELKKIARLDHDVNTPLCVITMSLGRAKKLGQDNQDETLLTNVEDILSAVARIGEIMQAVRVLKTNALIAYKRNN